MALDDELRQLFADDRLDVPALVGADQVIVAGARRVRRRRITAVTASGGLAVVGVIAVGIALSGGTPDAMRPAISHTSDPTTTMTTTTTAPPTQTSASQTVPPSATGKQPVSPAGGQEETEQTRTSEQPPPQSGLPVLGPTGFRALAMGQTQAQAQATGMVGTASGETYGDCSEYQLLVDGAQVGWVYFSGSGVAAIMPYESQTPEGVGPKWTVGQAAAVYPDLDVKSATANRYALVSVPGNASATFRLILDVNADTIARVTLQSATEPCFLS